MKKKTPPYMLFAGLFLCLVGFLFFERTTKLEQRMKLSQDQAYIEAAPAGSIERPTTPPVGVEPAVQPAEVEVPAPSVVSSVPQVLPPESPAGAANWGPGAGTPAPGAAASETTAAAETASGVAPSPEPSPPPTSAPAPETAEIKVQTEQHAEETYGEVVLPRKVTEIVKSLPYIAPGEPEAKAIPPAAGEPKGSGRFSTQSSKPVQCASNPNYIPITVYYGTDREATGDQSPANFYSWGKVTKLSYGTCVVTIPNTHTLGKLDSPPWWSWRKYDSNQDINVVKVDPCENDAVFVTRLSTGLDAGSQKEIFLFIHGFYNSFFDAARRTAQLAYDGAKEGYPLGIPVMYSFPSLGKFGLLDYIRDEGLLEASSGDLAQFLFTLHQNFPDVPINIVAHSMGNHLFCLALPKYLNLLARHSPPPSTPAASVSFSEVALEAPDEDEDAFKSEAPDLFDLAKRVTLYGCARDLGMELSEYLNGGSRIGDTRKRVFVMTGMDSIDATPIADITGHEYYALNPDIPLLFMHWSVTQRKLMEAKNGEYYILTSQHS